MQPSQIFQAPKVLRRIALTTKQGPHNYYKGNRVGSMGRHTKYGGYVLDYKKIRTYVVPDLTDFQVFKMTPFVPAHIPKPVQHFGRGGPLSGKAYIQNWKAHGGNI